LSGALHVLSGTLFFPRGGSAFVTRALAGCLAERGCDVTLIAGSRHDLGGLSDARRFYAGLDLHEVDFTAALGAQDGLAFESTAGCAPLQPSFEDRPGAGDRVFASLDDAVYECQVAAWTRELRAAGAARADVLHLHHLTMLNAAAAEVAPAVPVVGQLHGTELMMLEAIERDPGRWAHGPAWAERLRAWAARCERIVAAPGNAERAVDQLGIDPERVATLSNGFDPVEFRPLEVDRGAVWRRILVDEPRGWRPGEEPGSVRYGEAELEALARGPVIVYAGRFTAVKRIPMLLEAFADARERMESPATLVLVGGHPGEWEGEHPAEAIDRLGLRDALLAGWHDQSELPELLAASDLLVLPSARESFGQVIVEAMACGVPPIASASHGPAHIIDDGQTGWLFDLSDRAALTDALVEAVNRPAERERRAARAERVALDRFTWPAIAGALARILRDAARRTAKRRDHEARTRHVPQAGEPGARRP
jgi:glycosyltransferase involved in cell wall biosynthesis